MRNKALKMSKMMTIQISKLSVATQIHGVHRKMSIRLLAAIQQLGHPAIKILTQIHRRISPARTGAVYITVEKYKILHKKINHKVYSTINI